MDDPSDPKITRLEQLDSAAMAKILKVHFGTEDVQVNNDVKAQIVENVNQYFTSG